MALLILLATGCNTEAPEPDLGQAPFELRIFTNSDSPETARASVSILKSSQPPFGNTYYKLGKQQGFRVNGVELVHGEEEGASVNLPAAPEYRVEWFDNARQLKGEVAFTAPETGEPVLSGTREHLRVTWKVPTKSLEGWAELEVHEAGDMVKPDPPPPPGEEVEDMPRELKGRFSKDWLVEEFKLFDLSYRFPIRTSKLNGTFDRCLAVPAGKGRVLYHARRDISWTVPSP